MLVLGSYPLNLAFRDPPSLPLPLSVRDLLTRSSLVLTLKSVGRCAADTEQWVARLGNVMRTECVQTPPPPKCPPRLLPSSGRQTISGSLSACVSCTGLWAGLGQIVSWPRTLCLPRSSSGVAVGGVCSLMFICSAYLMHLVDSIVLTPTVPFTAVKSLLSPGR